MRRSLRLSTVKLVVFFFVFGSGGSGKTYLWRTLIYRLRLEGRIVLPVPMSGIAATLMPGRRTTHSRFKIPIVLDEFSLCNISHDSDIAQLIKKTKLIIWDKAPMQHRSRLWDTITYFDLKQNMRLKDATFDTELQQLQDFSRWVHHIGEGTTLHDGDDLITLADDEILIPEMFCNVQTENSVQNMISSTYPNFEENGSSASYLRERAILTPTNQTVGQLNSMIVDRLPGETFSYFSLDVAEDFGGTQQHLNAAFPVEYLNSVILPGLPLHEIKLKVGAVVMLIRNLNQILGLCNGTRMIVTQCLKFFVECEVICGAFIGTKHFIPCMELCLGDSKLPFKLVRKQMPLQLCYAMTINKSQGQSLNTVGLYLPKSVFSHGQFYVAVSRVTSPGGLKIFVDDESGHPNNITHNVVYKEVFYNLPRV
ncbi:uncharacterized protein LOC141690569 [Apium graveolens]|uniref:uncharacterized protein LOC141690569 n=1 Tax=Apium graveolens TaxID=4045 RepID=UPI003D7B2D7D